MSNSRTMFGSAALVMEGSEKVFKEEGLKVEASKADGEGVPRRMEPSVERRMRTTWGETCLWRV